MAGRGCTLACRKLITAEMFPYGYCCTRLHCVCAFISIMCVYMSRRIGECIYTLCNNAKLFICNYTFIYRSTSDSKREATNGGTSVLG